MPPLSFLTLAIVLFALSSEQTKVLGNQQNRTPVIISASVILLLSIVMFIWVTYYAIGYCRWKKHEELNRLKKQEIGISVVPQTTQASVVIFDNAAFTRDDPFFIDSPTNFQTSV